jgi:hypothetical protein
MRKRDVKVLGDESKEMLPTVSRKGVEITMLDC